MTRVEIKVEGLKELENKLRKFVPLVRGKKGFAKNPLRNAARAGAKVIKERAAELAPVNPETDTSLRGAIDMRIVSVKERDPFTRRGDSYEGYDIGYRHKKGGAWYGGFVELGTDRMPAQPYLRPALDQVRREAIEQFKDKLGADMDKIVKKLAAMR